MKKKIAILGSTGSIGKSTLDIVRKDRNNFDVVFLSANRSYKKLIEQAKEFNVKNVLIYNESFFSKVKFALRKSTTNVFTNNTNISNIISGKVDYTMSGIVGIAGLQPTVDAVKVSKILAIANKETIICAWHILLNLKKKYNTKIVPVDSEHFSILELTKNFNNDEIKEIIITASGGPFLNTEIKKLKNIKPNQATKHPTWKMGKKISVDSATMMNKVFEVLEAYKLFGFKKTKYRIMIHPQSYVHSIVHFKNGLVKMILYNPDMRIPIFNILYKKKNHYLNFPNIESKILNKLNFYDVNIKNFPSIKLIDKCFNLGFSTPIIVNASNEVLVDLFLNKKIGYLDIIKTINKVFIDKEFKKYARRKAKTVNDIKNIDNWARLKTKDISV